ncbi:MAG: ornithine cyclodeaminase family protein [Gammaproteobacteria bacterium]|jgi:ornithine cyclodeaminase|nr:ornithine cyclodeaminase family protein [Gammaproteobacteria bacterium]
MSLPYFDAAAIEAATPYPKLVAAIGDAFRDGGVAPARHAHDIPTSGGGASTLLLMPSWSDAGHFGVKLATINPANAARDIPTVNGTYVLFDRETATPRAVFDATALTARRTAAASAFAASKLAADDATSLLMIGTGRLSRSLIEAHATTRDISTVRVWGRSPEKAATIANWVRDNITDDAAVATDLDQACGSAHIISAATFATTPLIRGASLHAGVHVDLVGAYSPGMRETDAEVFRRADQVWVDTFEGAESEAGDLLAAIEEGAIELDDVAGDMFELARLAGAARHDAREITVFKSVGTGLEDLAAAILCETG